MTLRSIAPFLSVLLLLAGTPTTFAQTVTPIRPATPQSAWTDTNCAVTAVTRTTDGLRNWSPTGDRYLASRKDQTGIYQVYLGTSAGRETCVTCRDVPGGPRRGKHKLMPAWHPSGDWVFLGAERDNFEVPFYFTREMFEGLLVSGGYLNLYAMRPDGNEWFRLTDFGGAQRATGFTGTAFTPDGRHAVWAQIVDENPIWHLFGRWELMMADVGVLFGRPVLTNLRNITPPGAIWIEPGNFAPDGKTMLISSDIGMTDPQGQDQFLLDVTTGQVRNLNNTPRIWDEHGIFSPDGEKILFMSSYPFRDDPFRHSFLTLKTEFMLMNKDGSGLRQLTNFLTPGFPEYSPQNGLAANGLWSPDGRSVSVLTLAFPELQSWTISFAGPCGNR